MTLPFNPCDRSSWPELLTIDQMAAITQRTKSAVQNAVTRARFRPSPILGRHGKWEKPLRWKKAEVTRYLDAPATALRRVS